MKLFWIKRLIKLWILILVLAGHQVLGSESVQFHMGTDFFGYDLKSSQFAASQPIKSGTAMALTYENYDIVNQSLLRGAINQSSNSLTTDAALSPRLVDHVLTQFQISYLQEKKFSASTDYFWVGMGYSFHNSKTDRTSPNVLIVDSDMHAINFLGQYNMYFKNDISFNVLVDFALPFLRKEYGVITGYNVLTYYLSASYELRMLIDEKWYLSQKTELFLQQNEFSGSVSRGTLNAQERFQHFKLLIGAGYDF